MASIEWGGANFAARTEIPRGLPPPVGRKVNVCFPGVNGRTDRVRALQ